MEWLQNKYINLLSGQFRNFKRKNNTINFSCPYCGDSQKNKFKARGYLFNKKGSYHYYCHNCGASKNFEMFLRDQASELHKQYSLEKLQEVGGLKNSKEIDITPAVQSTSFPEYKRSGSPLRKLKKISQLEWDHPAKQYILQRKIPNPYHTKLYYAPAFYKWTNTLIPGKFKENQKDEPRLIIPFIDKNNKFFGYQGRSFKNSSLRYITIMLDESKPKCFGLETLKYGKTVYVTEGPLDSCFIDNCVAMAGSDISADLGDDVVMVYDNEPRSVEIVKKIEKAIAKQQKVVVWPSTLNYKDINDMVMGGLTKADVQLMIHQNTYSGLQANMALMNWRKC